MSARLYDNVKCQTKVSDFVGPRHREPIEKWSGGTVREFLPSLAWASTVAILESGIAESDPAALIKTTFRMSKDDKRK